MEYFNLQLTSDEAELITNAIVEAMAAGNIPVPSRGRAVGILNRIEWSREMDSIGQVIA